MKNPFSKALRSFQDDPSGDGGGEDFVDPGFENAGELDEVSGELGQAADEVLGQLSGSGGNQLGDEQFSDEQFSDGAVAADTIDPTSTANVSVDQFAGSGDSFTTDQEYSNFGIDFDEVDEGHEPGQEIESDVTATATGAIISKVMQRKLNAGQIEADGFAPRIQEVPSASDSDTESALSTMVVDSGGAHPPAPESPAPVGQGRQDAQQPRGASRRLVVNEDDLLKASRDRVVIIPRGNNTVIKKGSGFGFSQDAVAEVPPESPVIHVTAMAVPSVDAPVHQNIAQNPTKVPKLAPIEEHERAFSKSKAQELELRSAGEAASIVDDSWNDQNDSWDRAQSALPNELSEPIQEELPPALSEKDFEVNDAGFELKVDEAAEVASPEPTEGKAVRPRPRVASFEVPAPAASVPAVESEVAAKKQLDLNALVPGFNPRRVAPLQRTPVEPETAIHDAVAANALNWTAATPELAAAPASVQRQQPSAPEVVAGIRDVRKPSKVLPKASTVPATEFEKRIAELLQDDVARAEFETLAEAISSRLDTTYAKCFAISHVREKDYAEQVTTAVGTVLARQGYQTLVVDADIRTNGLTERFMHHSCEGFGESCDRHQLWQHVCKPTSVPRLSVLPSGTCADRSLLELDRLRRLFSEFSKGPYTAILLAVGEVAGGCTKSLCDVSDYAHVVVRLGLTERKMAQDLIKNSEIRFHGCIVTNVAAEAVAI